MEGFTLKTSMGVWEYGSMGVKHLLTRTLIYKSYLIFYSNESNESNEYNGYNGYPKNVGSPKTPFMLINIKLPTWAYDSMS